MSPVSESTFIAGSVPATARLTSRLLRLNLPDPPLTRPSHQVLISHLEHNPPRRIQPDPTPELRRLGDQFAAPKETRWGEPLPLPRDMRPIRLRKGVQRWTDRAGLGPEFMPQI